MQAVQYSSDSYSYSYSYHHHHDHDCHYHYAVARSTCGLHGLRDTAAAQHTAAACGVCEVGQGWGGHNLTLRLALALAEPWP